MARKELLYILCILIAVVLLSGCTGSTVTPTPTPAPTSTPTPVATVVITPTPTPTSNTTGIGHSRSDPLPLGQTIIADSRQKLEDGSTLTLKMALEQVVVGDAATKMLTDYNQFNSGPKEGNKYIFAKFKLELLNYPSDQSLSVSNTDFALVSNKGVESGTPIVIYDPLLQGELYKGQSREGWVLFEVPSDSSDMLIAFARGTDGSGGLWFKLS